MNYGSNKSGWRVIGGKKGYYRSLWEANYARYLQFQKEKGIINNWFHEPQTFWFEDDKDLGLHKIRRGVCSYKPDFQIIIMKREGTFSQKWVEVKGYMDARSATKIKRFRKYFPKEQLIVIDKKWFAKNNSIMRALIPDWEGDHKCLSKQNLKKKPLSIPIGLVLARRNANRYLRRAR